MVRRSGPLRVHIAPVGFEVRRVVEPLVQLRADRVYFITGSPGDLAREYWGRIHEAIRVEYGALEARDRFENPWDFHALLKLYGGLIQAERSDGNLVFVNVSTGTKISAMVGQLAGMFWGATPYYATTNYAKGTETVSEIRYPPTPRFQVLPKPQRELIVGLRAAARPVKKEELIAILRDADVFPEVGELSKASEYRRLDGFLEPLVEQQFVSVRGSRKAGRVELTQEGRDAALLLEYS